MTGKKPVLLHDEDGVFLSDGAMELRADFTHMLARMRPENLKRELMLRAAGIRNGRAELTVVDAAAGLGEDSLLFAAAGCTVRMYEYDPVIAALLEDAMDKAAGVPGLADAVSRMTLIRGDSISALPQLTMCPDVIYLDPMFPERKKSGLIKKKFQLLQQLESPCCNEDDLLHSALAAGPKRIVIKRPIRENPLAGVRPAFSLCGKTIRFDCVIP